MTVEKLTSPEEAIAQIRDGDTLLCGGFGLVGAALTLLDGLADDQHRDAT